MDYLSRKSPYLLKKDSSQWFFSENWNMKRKCRNIMRKREPWRVFLEWQNKQVNIFLLSNISLYLSNIVWWPTTLFLPDDEMFLIAYDYDGTLGFVHFWQELEKIIEDTIPFPEDIDQQKYIEFLMILQNSINPSSCIFHKLI